MKKERDEEEQKPLLEQQKPLFEVWLAAYNYRLVQVAQGSAGTKSPSAKEAAKPEPTQGTNE